MTPPGINGIHGPVSSSKGRLHEPVRQGVQQPKLQTSPVRVAFPILLAIHIPALAQTASAGSLFLGQWVFEVFGWSLFGALLLSVVLLLAGEWRLLLKAVAWISLYSGVLVVVGLGGMSNEVAVAWLILLYLTPVVSLVLLLVYVIIAIRGRGATRAS